MSGPGPPARRGADLDQAQRSAFGGGSGAGDDLGRGQRGGADGQRRRVARREDGHEGALLEGGQAAGVRGHAR